MKSTGGLPSVQTNVKGEGADLSGDLAMAGVAEVTSVTTTVQPAVAPGPAEWLQHKAGPDKGLVTDQPGTIYPLYFSVVHVIV